MSESVLPVSLSEISRNSTSATDSIGTMTIRTKNRRSRARKLIELHYVPVLGAIAQLGERLDRTQEVGGSSPPSSIPERPVLEPSLGSGTASRVAAAGLGTKQESSTTAPVARWSANVGPRPARSPRRPPGARGGHTG